MDITRPTVLEIDLNNFKHNVNQVQKYIGEKIQIMPVIKASGYGTYINKCLDIINEFDSVAVALVDEAVEIRNLGYKKEIFVLNQPEKNEIPKIIENDIIVGVSSIAFLKELGKQIEKVKIHVEIETGMGRTGVKPDIIDEYIDELKKYSNIEIEGVYTHFSSADSDFEYTKKQLNIFKNVVEKIINIVGELKYIHCSASNGILNFPLDCYNLVRPGIILYGYESYCGALEKLELKPICKLKSKIIFLKEVEENVSIGYSRNYITNKKTKVATIPIGYADGFKRSLSNKGEIVIKGKRVPIIGDICMDSFMVDVTDLENVEIGDDVYIWDNENIKVEEIAKNCGTINYEIISTVSDRVPRVFIRR